MNKPTDEKGRRRVVLVALDWCRPGGPTLPLGHANLLAALRQNPEVDALGHVLAVNQPDFCPIDAVESIAQACGGRLADVDDICLGTFVWAEPHVRGVMQSLRRAGFRGRFVLGGPQITYATKETVTLYPEATVFIRGYAEQTLPAVAATGEPQTPAGVQFANSCVTEPGLSVVDLGSLPSPYLTGILGVQPRAVRVHWETSRGCPYACAYCQHREADEARLVRAFGSDRLTAEARLFASQAAQEVMLVDPVFNWGDHGSRVLDLLVGACLRGKVSMQCRFELVTEDFLDACGRLNAFPEFGLQTIHEVECRAVNRRNNMDQVEQVILELHQRKMRFKVDLMYGLPEQTLQSFRESVDFCLSRRIPVVRAFPLEVLRGTALERQATRWGLRWDEDAIPKVIESNTFDCRDWAEMNRIAGALRRTEGHHPPSLESLMSRS
jgi:radical SAM superfamily enzyme YgiQ (UPF0313 family)